MKQRFGHEIDAHTPDNTHDYVIYSMHEETLMKRYEDNKNTVLTHVKELLPNLHLNGQWSLDIMQNGDDLAHRYGNRRLICIVRLCTKRITS